MQSSKETNLELARLTAENATLKRDKAQLTADLQFALRLHHERHVATTPAQQLAVEAYAARAMQAAHRGAEARKSEAGVAVRAKVGKLEADRAAENRLTSLLTDRFAHRFSTV